MTYEKACEMFDYVSAKWAHDGGCCGQNHFTQEWMRDVAKLSKSEISELTKFLEEHGGYCDCEVLLNTDRPEIWER